MDPESIYDSCMIYLRDNDGTVKNYPCSTPSALKNGKCNIHQGYNIEDFIEMDIRYVCGAIHDIMKQMRNTHTTEKKAHVFEYALITLMSHKYMLYHHPVLNESIYNKIIELMNIPIMNDIIEFDYYLDELYPLRNEEQHIVEIE